MNKITTLGNMMSEKYAVVCNAITDVQYRKIYGATKLHTDTDGSRMDMNDVLASRTLSVIIALNDDYEGGELIFPLQNYKIKLKKGQLIAFPPYWTHPHYTNEPENDTFRYTINTWLY
jgi:predicted 2-oxoglutarate/Fe(II)-dependent dioxygenase YbiX